MQKAIKDMSNEEKDDLLDAYRQALGMVRDIGYDYDGYCSANDLRALVDEMVDYAKKGLRGQRPQYINQGDVGEYINGKWVIVPKERWDDLIKEWKKMPGW